MDILKAIVLGVIQGITEWLPISSNAHLKVIPSLLGWPDPGAPAVAVMQLGTVAAVLVYFRQDIARTLKGVLAALRDPKQRNSPEARLGMAVAIGTVPIIIAALALKKAIEGPLRSNYVIAVAFIVGGVLLYAAEMLARKVRPLESIQTKDGLLVGLAQCMALVPGMSRSGSTLIGAFLTGLDKVAAVRFSFLLSIPAVTLAGLFELKDFIKPPLPEPGAAPTMHWTSGYLAISTVVAFFVGYATIAWLLKYLSKHSTLVFVLYRIVLGVTLLALLTSHRLTP